MDRIIRAAMQACRVFGLTICLGALAACAQKSEPEVVTANGGDDEGIGGTGIHNSEGIGGTGIIGVVSDVENFTVNGQSIEIDEWTTVEIDGKLGSQSDLRRGQVVMVEAGGPATSLRADYVSIRHEIVGPITRIKSDTDELFVLDLRVSLAPDARELTSVNVGDWVAVSGLRISNGEILGTRIERREASRTAQVYGRYSLNRDDRTRPVRIANMSVSGLPPEQALIGRDVLLQARFEGGRLFASKIKPQDDVLLGDNLENFSIAAYVDQRSDQTQLFGLSLLGLAEGIDAEKNSFEREGNLIVMEGRRAKTTGAIDIQTIHSLEDPFEQPSKGRLERETEGGEKEPEGEGQLEKTGAPKPADPDLKGYDAKPEKLSKDQQKQDEKARKDAEKKAKDQAEKDEKAKKDAEKKAKDQAKKGRKGQERR